MIDAVTHYGQSWMDSKGFKMNDDDRTKEPMRRTDRRRTKVRKLQARKESVKAWINRLAEKQGRRSQGPRK